MVFSSLLFVYAFLPLSLLVYWLCPNRKAKNLSLLVFSLIFGKPVDKEDAVSMLTRLSGRKHVVATGVALITYEGTRCFTEETLVEFYDLDKHQKDLIERYCSSDEPDDKAGAYGIQNGGALLVRKIDGDFSNVVGLPVPRLAREMESVIY